MTFYEEFKNAQEQLPSSRQEEEEAALGQQQALEEEFLTKNRETWRIAANVTAQLIDRQIPTNESVLSSDKAQEYLLLEKRYSEKYSIQNSKERDVFVKWED